MSVCGEGRPERTLPERAAAAFRRAALAQAAGRGREYRYHLTVANWMRALARADRLRGQAEELGREVGLSGPESGLPGPLGCDECGAAGLLFERWARREYVQDPVRRIVACGECWLRLEAEG